MRVPKVDCGQRTFAFFESGLLDGAVVLSNQITLSFIYVLAVAQQCSSQPTHQRFLNKAFTGRSIDSKSSNAFPVKTGQTAMALSAHVCIMLNLVILVAKGWTDDL